MNGAFDRAFESTRPLLVLYALCAASAGHAQLHALEAATLRQAIEAASQPDCDRVSVVVRQCVPPSDANSSNGNDDPLTRSRARAKAAFERQDRRARQDAPEGNAAPSEGASSGNAQRLAPVVVTGNADEPPPTVEQILQRALNPPQPVVSANGTVTNYSADGTRAECVARCVGPMCCVVVPARESPARASNSIGR